MKKTTQKVISLLLAICLLSGLMAPAAAIVAPKAAGGDTLEILPVAPQKGPAGDFPAEDLLPTEPLLPEEDRLPEEEFPQEEGLKEDPSATALVAPSLSEEIPVDGMTATTGSEEPAGNHPNEGPASNALDNNEGTIWHSLWASSPMENLWIAIDLKGTYLLDGFKYLPRQGAGGSNGLITGYKIYASTDGSTWGTAVATGTWDYGSGNSDRSQKTAAFTTPVLASHVKLVATTTVSDPGKHFAAAAELRVTGTAPVYEASFDDDAHRGGWKKDGGNASGGAAIAFTDGSGDAGFATISVNNEPAHFVGADAIPQADGFVEADITPIGTNQQFALAFRYTSNNSYIGIGYDKDVKWNWCGANGSKWGDEPQKLSAQHPPVAGTKFRMRIEYVGTNVRLLIDGAELFNGVLPSGTGANSTEGLPTGAGKCGFRVWGQGNNNSIKLDNVRMGALPKTYAVNVVGGTASPSTAARGETVTVTAATPAGVTFSHWSSEDGVTFTDANVASTTFTMPAKAVTVKANFAYPEDTTFYVDSANGSDSNSGTTADAPWKTLGKVNSVLLRPGSKVYLKAGSVFADQGLSLRGNGTAAKPILVDMYNGATIGTAAGAKPIINANGVPHAAFTMGNEANTGSTAYPDISYGLHIKNMSHITVKNLEITNNPATRELAVGAVVEASGNGLTSGIHLDGLNVHDVKGDKLQKTAPNGGIYFITTVANPSGTIANDHTRYDDISVQNCTVKNVSRTGISVGSSHSAHSWEGHGGGIIPENVKTNYGHTKVLIKNNFVDHAGGDAIVPQFCISPLVEHNISAYASQNTPGGGEMFNAGIWPWRCEDALFQFNEAYHTMKNGDGQAYDCDSSRGTVYQYNYSHDNGNGFMLFCQAQSVQSTVRYNVSQNDLGRIFLVSNTQASQVYNNTFYIGAGLNTNIVEGGGPMDLKNNIFYTAGTRKSPNWGNFTYDNNLYFGFTTTPNDAHKITTDPMFVDPGKGGIGVEGNSAIDTLGGYALLEGSPAIGVGLLISNNGGKDYEGNLVSATEKPNLGAFQRVVANLGVSSTAYTVDQSNRIIKLNEHIAVAGFLAKLTPSTGATMKAMKNNAEYTSGDVDETVTVVVTKDSKTVTYAVEFAYPPAVLTSNTYTVNDTASTISIEEAVLYSTFVAGLTAAPLVTFAVKHGADTITGGDVVENDTVAVTSGSQTKTYTVKYVVIADHYNYETDFKDNTQGPVWYNEYRQDGTTKLFTDWRGEWKCWVALSEKLTAGVDNGAGNKGLISATSAHPTAETYFTWVAPKSGTVELGIAYPAYLRNNNNNNDTHTAGFRILKNGTAISADTLAWKNGGMLMRPLVVNVAKGDRISFATFMPATNQASDASTHFNPTVDYVTDKEPLVETNAAKTATKTASSTAANYAVNGLTDDNVSATRKSFEWKAGAVSDAWVNFALAEPQCVTRLMLAPGKDTAIESDVKITLSDGTTQTIAKASLVSTNGYVAVPLTAPRRTSSVKLEFTTAAAAVTVGDVQILTDAATTASYAALLATYNANKDKVETDYATAQWAAFAAARTAADSLLKNTAATKAQMDAAATALSGAAGSLVRVYAITLTPGTGYTLAGAPKAESGKDYSFTLTLDAPYSNAAPVVKVDGVALTKASQAGAVLTYTITAVAAAKTVTVEPLTKNSYTVTFHVNGGDSTPPNMTISHGDAYGALPTPTTAVPNKDFDGWYTQETGGTKVTAETLVTATHTLWAHWIDQGASISPVPTISGMPATIALPHTGGIPLTVPTASTYTYLWECSKAEGVWETVGTDAGYTVPEADVRVAHTGWQYRCTVTNTEPGKTPTTVVGVAVTLTVTKGAQNVPTVAGDEGKITGLLAEKSYEYKLSDAADYTPVPAGSTELAGLTPGTYLVRLAGDETYLPSADATVTVLAVKYALTVQGGTGDGRYAPGTTITIIADAPESGKVFDKWTTADGVTFTEATAATTTFTMVANAVTVTATYKLLEYPISVMRGTANPSAAHLGQSVTITAAEPPEGKTFDKWTSASGVIFADATAATTTFTMVAKQVAITATYRALEYTVTVAGGTTTTPSVPMGDKASATAAEPAEGMVFEKWTTSDGVHFDTVTGTTTTFTMPAKNVTVTAVYRALAYTVTVAGGTTATPQAHKGDTVTITANTPESGKMFDKWTSEDGLIFAGEATATFLMPAKNVTATAHYRELPPTPPTPPPSGGGGGSTGGGGTPPIPELKPELPKTENGSTTVTTPVQSESKGSSASATVSEKTVTSAIETAVKEAERTGTVAGVVIKVDAPAASKSVELSISKSSIAAVAKGKTESLKITSPVAEISLDSKALSAVAEATDKQVKITATCIEPASLTPVQSVKVGDVPVYDFTITDGKTEVSDFRGGSATVSLPYTLKDAEEGAYVTVWYLASDGSLRPVTAQYEAGRVTFTVGHFSRYAVGYLPFNDVETGWYYESVVYVYGSKILGGVGKNSFAPDARMTRAMLLTALYRMSGEKSDVQGETWYANAVAWAVEKGISDGKQLDGEVTRAQLATMIYRYYFAMQTADGDLTSGQNAALAMPQDCTFADRESIAPWARDAAAWCGANGIITGRVGNHFGPDGMATRAEVALVLLRLSEKSQG